MKVIVFLTICAVANAAFLPNQSKYSECDKACPYIYLPVCGGNGNGEFQMFSNDCIMDVENCNRKQRHESEFTEAPMKRCHVKDNIPQTIVSCDKPCPDNLNPTCGYDGNNEYKMFSNACEMEVENCNRGLKREIVFNQVDLKMCKSITVKMDEIDQSCNIPCTDIYLPVCGFNGVASYKIFASECIMDVENCYQKQRHEAVFEEVHMEACKIIENQSKEIADVNDEELYKHCNKPCLSIYNPVCGFDGRTETKIFASECDMEVENCKVQIRSGFVFKRLPLQMCNILDSESALKAADKKKNCVKICTADYNPVCGFNGVEYHTFGNQCDFEMQNCESNFNWRFTKMGECA